MLKALKLVMIWFCAGFLLLGPAFSSYSAHRCLQQSETVQLSDDDCCSTDADCCEEPLTETPFFSYAAGQQCCVDVTAYFNFPVFSEKMEHPVKVFPFTVNLFVPALQKETGLFPASFIEEKVHPPNIRTAGSRSLSFTGVLRV